MTNHISEAELQQVLKIIFKKSQTDHDFRQRCLTNPAQVVFELTGKKLPKGAQLNFVE